MGKYLSIRFYTIESFFLVGFTQWEDNLSVDGRILSNSWGEEEQVTLFKDIFWCMRGIFSNSKGEKE
jgi:hypothetical protein